MKIKNIVPHKVYEAKTKKDGFGNPFDVLKTLNIDVVKETYGATHDPENGEFHFLLVLEIEGKLYSTDYYGFYLKSEYDHLKDIMNLDIEEHDKSYIEPGESAISNLLSVKKYIAKRYADETNPFPGSNELMPLHDWYSMRRGRHEEPHLHVHTY